MYTIKASLGVQAEGRTRATYCLDTRDANPYEQGAQLRGVRIRVGLREHAVRSNPWLLCEKPVTTSQSRYPGRRAHSCDLLSGHQRR